MSPPTWLFWPVVVAPSGGVAATGGTVTDVDGYRYHTFTSSGSFEVSTGGSVEVLLVAGGGAGGAAGSGGGGGGAGGVRLLDGGNALTLTATTYTITVGGGGAGAAIARGGSGSDSSIVGGSVDESAIGGGGGGGTSPTSGLGGGSGGGGFRAGVGGLGIPGQGNDGGAGDNTAGGGYGGGGGGGAAEAGAAATYGVAGNGGNGITVWGTTYGGGGGGATQGSTQGTGGSGGGGDGGSSGQAGAANTGGGGGASASFINPGGDGGSGIVIIRYPIGGTVLWTPSDLSDLVVWLDADDTLFSNNDAVDAWTNKGSGGNTAQSDSAKRPIFKTNLLNSKPGIDFDGTNDCLQIASLALDTYISVFAVTKTTTAKPWFIEHSANSLTNDGFYLYGSSSDHYTVRRSLRNAYSGTSGWLGSAAAQVGLIIDGIAGTGPMGDVFKDGVLQADGSTAGGRDVNLSNSSVTATLNIGARDNGAAIPMDGELHELIIYNQPLAQTDREKVEGYLAHKWGLTASLPAGHPYKNAAPTV